MPRDIAMQHRQFDIVRLLDEYNLSGQHHGGMVHHAGFLSRDPNFVKMTGSKKRRQSRQAESKAKRGKKAAVHQPRLPIVTSNGMQQNLPPPPVQQQPSSMLMMKGFSPNQATTLSPPSAYTSDSTLSPPSGTASGGMQPAGRGFPQQQNQRVGLQQYPSPPNQYNRLVKLSKNILAKFFDTQYKSAILTQKFGA